MNTTHSLLIILVVAAVTILTRALPFLLFPANRPLPGILAYIGSVLQGAVMAMLVVYCFRSINFTVRPWALPDLIAAAVVIGLYLWKKNILLSIALGTVLYMVLVQLVFA